MRCNAVHRRESEAVEIELLYNYYSHMCHILDVMLLDIFNLTNDLILYFYHDLLSFLCCLCICSSHR